MGHEREREVGKGKKGPNRESIYFHGQHVIEFLTESCMFCP